ncbi:hypothetical protein TNCV_3988791 [Trichonephila clavipes]|nr:hypothetical protein TNCV_3988791 [Trichonephila clavipes]
MYVKSAKTLNSLLWGGVSGRGNRGFKVSDRGWPCREFDPSITKDPSCRGAISLAEIMEVEIEVVSQKLWRWRYESSIVPSGVSQSLNRTVTCMVLKANDRRTSCPCHDEFRGPRSDYVRQTGNEYHGVTSLDSDYLTPTGGGEYGVRLMMLWIQHTRLKLYKGMVAQSCRIVALRRGRGSLVVKISDRDWHVTSSSPVPLTTHRVGVQCALNLLKPTRSFVGVMWKLGEDRCQLRFCPLHLSIVQNDEPKGHSHEIAANIIRSQVRVLIPLKTSLVEELMYVKSVIAQSPPIGMVWKFGELFQLRCHIFIIWQR